MSTEVFSRQGGLWNGIQVNDPTIIILIIKYVYLLNSRERCRITHQGFCYY